MQRRTGLVLAGAVACLGALTAVAGSVGSPVVTGGANYEVGIPWESLLERGETAAGVAVAGSGDSDLMGGAGSGTPIGQLVVFSAWLLVAFRKMDALAGVFTALAGLLALVVLYLFTAGGTAPSATRLLGGVTPETRLLVLSAAVVGITAAIALSLPTQLHRSDRNQVRLPTLDRFRSPSESGSDAATSREPSPSNPVEQAWWDVTRRIDDKTAATRTPREIESAAADAGLTPDAVANLRRLFEEVRYGDAPVTDERRERARALRNRVDGNLSDGSPTEAETDRSAPGPVTDGSAGGPADDDPREGPR